MTAHAYSLLDSNIYGFALQESVSLPFDKETAPEAAERILAQSPTDTYLISPSWQSNTSSNPATTTATNSNTDSN
jgi:hypothetical protein